VTASDPSWMLHAACLGYPEPLWDARQEGEPQAQAAERWERAVAFCRACPVTSACLALRQPHDGGVWGGQVFDGGYAPVGSVRRSSPASRVTDPEVEPCTQCGHPTVREAYWKRHPEIRADYRGRIRGLCVPCYDRDRAARRPYIRAGKGGRRRVPRREVERTG